MNSKNGIKLENGGEIVDLAGTKHARGELVIVGGVGPELRLGAYGVQGSLGNAALK